jgi:hypothetical protein
LRRAGRGFGTDASLGRMAVRLSAANFGLNVTLA